MNKLGEFLFNLGWKVRFILTKERHCDMFDNTKTYNPCKIEHPNYLSDAKYSFLPTNIYYHK